MAIKRETSILHDAAEAVGDGEDINIRNRPGVVLQVTGTFSATITPKGTLDGSNWYGLSVYAMDDGTRATTITSTGLYYVNVSGLAAFKAEITSRTSGSITVHAATALHMEEPQKK